MSLQHLKFDTISEGDLCRLVDDGIGESKTLEYKKALVLDPEHQKREFLSDVTALANTDGGDLVFGMKESEGGALELVGLKNFTPDDAIGRIENLLRDSIHPRLVGVQLRALQLSNGNHALLIRIPRSFNAPHMVSHKGVTRFCGRNSNGKYDLDVQELRSAFLANESLSDRLKSFRIDRINKIIAGETPIPLTSVHLMVLHLLPVISARPETRLESSDFRVFDNTPGPRPIGSNHLNHSFNFDGFLTTSSCLRGPHNGYVQIFRNGFLESVESETLNFENPRRQDPDPIIPSIAWEEYILSAFPSYLKALDTLKIPPPYVASISMLNVRGFTMYVGPEYYTHENRPVDRDHLLTNEILIESTSDDAGRLLRPLFDQIWNACGWHGSINYDKEGNWKHHR